jgi:hypothetical protein
MLRVFEALAPALLTGRPEPIRDYEHLKLIYGIDAADYQLPPLSPTR